MIPEQVRRQAEEAERLQQQLIARPEAQTEEPEPEAETQPEPEKPDGDQGNEQETPSPKPSEPKASQSEPWEQRYYSLKGKYDAEVGPLIRQNRELQQQLQALTARIDELSRQRAEPEKKPEPQTPGVTPQDVENFGSDLIDLIKRAAREVVMTYAGELLQEIESVKAQNAELRNTLASVEERHGKTAQHTFVEQLTKLVPDWEQINVDERFLVWLQEPDPLSGIVRKVLLDAAAKDLDVKRVAALFNAWKAGVSAPTPPLPPPPQPVPTQRKVPVKPEVSAQVAPGKSRATPPVPAADPSQRIWSQSEIAQFYEDVKLGRYRGNPEEQARIEAEIDLAVAQGRVR